jgi:predicted dehydrogenase
MDEQLIELDYKPHLPAKMDYGIAVVGCGSIVTHATLPCYREHNLNIVGCYDIDPKAANKLAQRFDIPKTYDDLESLQRDPAVDIVEIAVRPSDQLGIVRGMSAAGKHLLCQKPLSDTFAEAVEIVETARAAGIKLAVNQQMRWDQAIRAAKQLIGEGWIGRPIAATIEASFFSPIPGSWYADLSRYEIFFHSIHYLDSLRFLFGEPEFVTSRHAKYPLEGKVLGETKTITVLDYSSGLQALVTANMCDRSYDHFVNYRFLGTEGVIKGTIGLLKYPAGEPDTLIWSSLKHSSKLRFEANLEGNYLFDSFIGPIGSLMGAIQNGGVPETDGADNLNTLRICEAAYLSAAENRSVQP